MRTDTESDWPTRLLSALAKAPLVSEQDIDIVAKPAGRRPLGAAELAVLEMMSLGMTTTKAAKALLMAPETVKEHLKMARFKLEAANTTGACCQALRRKLIT